MIILHFQRYIGMFRPIGPVWFLNRFGLKISTVLPFGRNCFQGIHNCVATKRIYLPLFATLSRKSVKAYTTMSIGIKGSKTLVLFD